MNAFEDSGEDGVAVAGGPRGTADVLRRIDLFKRLGEEELATLASLFTESFYATEDVIFRHDEAADAFYVVRQGAVALFRDEVGRPLQLLARYQAGEYFGEIGLVDGDQRHATARATEPSRILRVGRQLLLDFLEDHPDVELMLHMAAARRHSENVAATLGVGPRDEVRIRIHREVLLRFPEGGGMRVVLENLSKGGLSLRGAPASWRPPVELRFTLQFGGERFDVEGRVSWRSGDVLGLAFTDEVPDREARIQRALHQLLEPASE